MSQTRAFATQALPILKPLGLIGSGILFGSTATVTLFALPSILHASTHPTVATSTHSPNPLLTQWRFLYTTAAKSFPAAAVLTALTYGEIGYLEAQLGKNSPWPWVQCAALTVAILPFTFGLMWKQIGRLMGKEAEGYKMRELEQELKGWGRMNIARAMFHAAAAWVGVREVVRRGL